MWTASLRPRRTGSSPLPHSEGAQGSGTAAEHPRLASWASAASNRPISALARSIGSHPSWPACPARHAWSPLASSHSALAAASCTCCVPAGHGRGRSVVSRGTAVGMETGRKGLWRMPGDTQPGRHYRAAHRRPSAQAPSAQAQLQQAPSRQRCQPAAQPRRTATTHPAAGAAPPPPRRRRRAARGPPGRASRTACPAGPAPPGWRAARGHAVRPAAGAAAGPAAGLPARARTPCRQWRPPAAHIPEAGPAGAAGQDGAAHAALSTQEGRRHWGGRPACAGPRSTQPLRPCSRVASSGLHTATCNLPDAGHAHG